MDFGKLAYLKAEELEQKILNRRQERIKNTGLSVYPNFSLRLDNDYNICKINASSRVAVLVNIALDTMQAGRVTLYFGDKKVTFCDVKSVGISTQFLAVSTRISGLTQLSLKAENGFIGHIEALSVTAIGDDAAIAGLSKGFAAVDSGKTTGVLFIKDNNIVLRSNSINSAEFTDRVIGGGSVADLASDGNGGFYIAFTDNSNNFWIKHITSIYTI